MKPETIKRSKVVRDVIRKYGYRNLMLEYPLQQAELARMMSNREAVIQELMQKTGLSYSYAYEEMAKMLRLYKKGTKGRLNSLRKCISICMVCRRPVVAFARTPYQLCYLHRRLLNQASLNLSRKKKNDGRWFRGLSNSSEQALQQIQIYRDAAGCLMEMLDDEVVRELLRMKDAQPQQYQAALQFYCTELQASCGLEAPQAHMLVIAILKDMEKQRWKQLSIF